MPNSTRKPISPVSRNRIGPSGIAASWTWRIFARFCAWLTRPTVASDSRAMAGTPCSKLSVTGRYTADQILMKYTWFHPGNISAHGGYHTDGTSFDSPDLEALLLGGSVVSNLHIDLHKLEFRAESKARGLDLHQALAAEDNPGLPIVPLHWGSRIDVDATTTWVADFKHLDSRGVMLWTPPIAPPPEQIPATARFEYNYEMDRQQVELAPGEIITPLSRVQFGGALSMIDSSLDMTVDSDDLTVWDDFINRIRGVTAEPQIIGGRIHWQGRMTGRLDRPTFTGHVKANDARYGSIYWDELETDLTYSKDGLHLVRGRARRGRSSGELELTLGLDNWNFAPESEWTFDVNLSGADTDDLQKLFGVSYSAHGLLNGQFHGKGTRAAPEFSGLFDLSNVTAGLLEVRSSQRRAPSAERRGANFECRGAPPGLLARSARRLAYRKFRLSPKYRRCLLQPNGRRHST